MTTETLHPSDPPPVQCEVCLKEVPPSEAQSAEGSDYVLYFCGLECYQEWREKQSEER